MTASINELESTGSLPTDQQRESVLMQHKADAVAEEKKKLQSTKTLSTKEGTSDETTSVAKDDEKTKPESDETSVALDDEELGEKCAEYNAKHSADKTTGKTKTQDDVGPADEESELDDSGKTTRKPKFQDERGQDDTEVTEPKTTTKPKIQDETGPSDEPELNEDKSTQKSKYEDETGPEGPELE